MMGFFKIWLGLSSIKKSRKAANDITFFDVKELYNQAYEQKAQARNALRQYRKIVAKAKVMDRAYREQLSENRRAA